MGQVLFISHNPELKERITQEAAGKAIFVDQALQGLKIITNPEIPLSGIYLDPSDRHYSSLRFLELTLIQRPATPIYFIHPDLNLGNPRVTATLKRHHLRGGFLGTESFRDMTFQLNLDQKAIAKRPTPETAKRPEFPGYLAIPILDFREARKYPFNVFVESKTRSLSLFATADSSVDLDYLNKAAATTAWLYVDAKEVQCIRERIRDSRVGFLEDEDFPIVWKTAEVLFQAKMILSEIRKNTPSENTMEQTLGMISSVFTILGQLTDPALTGYSVDHLQRFIAQAKDSDHAIAAMTLSILLCKSLMFERDAVIEILGVAALLQDISLYQSPFGDLSKVPVSQFSHDMQNFYEQHPIASANLMAQASSVPDVTLQVIRQHHERKDRTGFPNRIGGTQLHPMAEVLSLINAFLELNQGHADITPAVSTKLTSEVFPHYSERVITQFRKVINLQMPARIQKESA